MPLPTAVIKNVGRDGDNGYGHEIYSTGPIGNEREKLLHPEEYATYSGIADQILKTLKKFYKDNQIKKMFQVKNPYFQRQYYRFDVVKQPLSLDYEPSDNWQLKIKIDSRISVEFNMGDVPDKKLRQEVEWDRDNFKDGVTLLAKKMLVMDTFMVSGVSCKEFSEFEGDDNDIIIHAICTDSGYIYSTNYYALFRIKFNVDFISVSLCPNSEQYPELEKIRECGLKPIGSIQEFKTFITEELRKKPLKSQWSELERRMDGLLFVSS